MASPKTIKVVAKCKKLFKSALYLDNVNGLAYNTVIHRLLHNLGRVDDYEEYGDVCWGICMYMISLCGKAPQRMDHLLRLYYRLADRTVRREHRMFGEDSIFMDVLGTHSADLSNSRNRHYGDLAERYSSLPGGVDSKDQSKLVFSQEDVETNFERVKRAVRFQATQKSEDVVAGAIVGRHAALMASGACKFRGVWWGFVDDIGVERRLAKTIGPGYSTWSASGLIALLLSIRGRAKSVFSKPGVPSEKLGQKKARWVKLLKRWLWDENFNVGNDRLVKHHVLLTLENLLDGPFDETSEQLFMGKSWVF